MFLYLLLKYMLKTAFCQNLIIITSWYSSGESSKAEVFFLFHFYHMPDMLANMY